MPNTAFIYDDLLTQEVSPVSGTTTHLYNEYDRFGRITQDGSLGYQFDDNGNRTQIDYPGGVKATYIHDYADRESTLSYDAGSGAQPLVAVI